MQTIMIVEDDQTIRDELALLLENEGYRSITVSDFTGIIAQAVHNAPDLILLDINLPEKGGEN